MVVERPVHGRKMIREAGAGTGRTAEWTSGGRADVSTQQKMNWCNEPSGSQQPNPNPLPIAHHILIIPIHRLIVPQGSGLLMFSLLATNVFGIKASERVLLNFSYEGSPVCMDHNGT